MERALTLVLLAAVLVSGCISGSDKPAVNPLAAEAGATGTNQPAPWPFGPAREERSTYEMITEKERALLPECSDAMLTLPPVDLGRITAIEPIGSSNPPEHTLASSSTDTYIAVDTQNTESTVPLYAPGKIWITVIQPRYGVTQDPEDHVIHYALCRDVFGIVDHVKSFSPEMMKIVENYKCPYGGTPGDSRCPILLLEPVEAGTKLGEVGRKQGNFNFGTWDLRHTNNFVNPARYGVRSLHSTCPFGYYSSPLREQLAGMLDREDRDCGTVEYDVPGTLQGEWFYNNATNRMRGDWFNQLFLGYSNRLPEAAVISVGGVISEPIKWMFVPEKSGTRNAGFETVSGSGIYCYESDRSYWNYEKGPGGRIIIQLISPQKLRIEHQQGTCSGAYSFASPKIYER